MKLPVHPRHDAEIPKDYPIADRLPGWFFRLNEVSAATFLVEGTDRWGRKVHRSGVDPEALLIACVLDAQVIEEQLKTTSPANDRSVT